jgi:hypothetical protein
MNYNECKDEDMEQPLHLGIDGVLDGGDVLPGFSVKLVDVVGRED